MPSPPKVPNAKKVSNTQQQYNSEAQIGSAVNQTTPYGSLNYSFGTGPNGETTLTANQKLSDQQQNLLNIFQGTQGEAGQAGQNLLKNANYGNGPVDFSGAQNEIVQQNLGHYTDALKPYFTQQTNDLDNQLRNQGLVPGSQAYDDAMNNMRQSQGQTVSGFLSSAEPQAYNQAQSQYLTPLNTASSLAQLGSPNGFGGALTNTPTQAGVNYSQNAQNAYNAKQANYSGMLSGIAGIGGAILGGPIGGAIGSGIGGMLGGGGGFSGVIP